MPRPVNRGRVARPVMIPAPVGGWNTRDSLAAMPAIDAQEIVNFFPTSTSVDLRKGYSEQATIRASGGTVDIETAFGFVRYADTSLWAVGKIEGASSTAVTDVVAGTQMTFASTTTDLASYVQFANSGGNYVAVVFPGAGATNAYHTYDGATWTSRGGATTGASAFKTVAAFQNRLWFTKGGSDLNAYYLATAAITGVPTAFDLGGYATRGGGLYAIGTWTLDGGVGGTDDLIVFLTTMGQAIVYQGTDPSSAASWRLVGVFDVSKPVGRPLKYGADLLLVCEDGLYSMAEVLRGNAGVEFTVSDKIRSAWQAGAAGASFSITNVTCSYSPKLNMLVANFPTSAYAVTGPQTSQWFVMNTITKAWTKFVSLNAWAIDVMAGYVYLANVGGGPSGTLYVLKFGTNTSDAGVAITGYARQAYNYLGSPGSQKLITGLLPSFNITGSHTVGYGIDRDFRNALAPGSLSTRAYATGTYRPLLSYPACGDALAIFAEVSSSVSAHSWYSTTLSVIPGGLV